MQQQGIKNKTKARLKNSVKTFKFYEVRRGRTQMFVVCSQQQNDVPLRRVKETLPGFHSANVHLVGSGFDSWLLKRHRPGTVRSLIGFRVGTRWEFLRRLVFREAVENEFDSLSFVGRESPRTACNVAEENHVSGATVGRMKLNVGKVVGCSQVLRGAFVLDDCVEMHQLFNFNATKPRFGN